MRFLPLLGLLLALPAAAAPTRLAVMDLRCDQRDQAPELAKTLTEVVAYELGATGKYQVVTTQDLATALQLKGVQQGIGCESEACEAKLGQAAEVEQFVSGLVGRAGSRLFVTLKLLDAKSVTVARQVRRVVPANEDAMFDAVTEAARELLNPPPPPAPLAEGTGTGMGGLGLRGGGLGGGGSGQGIGLGSIGTLGHGSGTGMGFGGSGARAAAPAKVEAPVSNEAECRLAKALSRILARKKDAKNP